MSVDFLNSPYGLFTPMNYWMLQNAAQQYGSSLNFMGNMGMGGMPGYIPVTSSDTSGTHTATPSTTEKAQQKKDIEVQLEEAFALRAQLSDYVDVNTSQGLQRINAEAFNKETGYIAEDGKDDGKISWTNKLFNFGKGCVNLVTDMFFDENGHLSLKKAATTLVVGGALGAAAFLIPGAGAVLAGAALAGGALTLGTGIVQSNTTTTDEGAEKAWQNIGSGTLQTVLAAFGIRKVGVNAANKLSLSLSVADTVTSVASTSASSSMTSLNISPQMIDVCSNVRAKYEALRLSSSIILIDMTLSSFSRSLAKYNDI